MSRTRFIKPFPGGRHIRKKSAPYHKTSYQMTHAIDYAMPVGTPVLAAAKGRIFFIRQNMKKNYSDKNLDHKANYIIIEHSNDECSEYLHLAPYSCVVKVGDIVHAGQLIALSGETGYATYPHLHFNVTDYRGQSIPITFLTKKRKKK